MALAPMMAYNGRIGGAKVKRTPTPKKVKNYVKVSLNIPDVLFDRVEAVAETLGADRTRLVIRALESCIDQFEREAEAVKKVRDADKK